MAGGRGGDDALAALRESVDSHLAAASRQSHEEATAYSEALGRKEAVHGLPAVADAFAQGNVRTLFLHADRGADPGNWGATADPKLVASSPDALGELQGSAFEAPASALLLRAATLTGSTFSELLPGTLADDGAAAVLRYSA